MSSYLLNYWSVYDAENTWRTSETRRVQWNHKFYKIFLLKCTGADPEVSLKTKRPAACFCNGASMRSAQQVTLKLSPSRLFPATLLSKLYSLTMCVETIQITHCILFQHFLSNSPKTHAYLLHVVCLHRQAQGCSTPLLFEANVNFSGP